jgi:Mn-dependent DtxR family transcriptional regulator
MESEARKIRSMLNEYHSGSLRSTNLTDEDIVAAIVRLGARTKETAVLTPQIAAELGVDGRGISKRLPRMSADGMIMGDKDSGYWVPRR